MSNSANNIYSKDSRQIRNAFNFAAENYDAYSILQRTITDRLIESFDHIKIRPSLILDMGSGTGYGAKKIKQYFKKAHVYQLDLSDLMLNKARKKSSLLFSKDHFVCANACQTPLPDKSFDLIFSSLMLQWCDDLDMFFAEIKRLLKPKGVFVFSSFGPDTLKELRQSWQQVDDQIHVNMFVDMHDVGDVMVRNGLDAPVLTVEHIVLAYDKCKQLMQELKNIGAHNVNDGRRKSLTGKNRLMKMVEHYETFRENGKLPATYEVIYGHAWQAETIKKNNAPGEQTVSLDSLKQGLKNRRY